MASTLQYSAKDCYFKGAGCPFTGVEDNDVKEHLKQNVDKHLLMVLATNKQKDQLLQQSLSKTESAFEDMRNEFSETLQFIRLEQKDIKENLASLKENFTYPKESSSDRKMLLVVISILVVLLASCLAAVLKFNNALHRTSLACWRSHGSFENQKPCILSRQVSEGGDPKLFEHTLGCFHYVEIPDFELTTGKVYKSDRFYSQVNGYKHHLVVSVADENRLMASVYISEGRNDDDLDWPAGLTYEMTIRDVTSKGEHVTGMATAQYDHEGHRPSGDRSYQTYVSLFLPEGKSLAERHVRDKTLTIELCVYHTPRKVD